MDCKSRFMNSLDWKEEKVTRVPHLNNTCVPSGYNRTDGICGNPLLPACVFEDKLEKIFYTAKERYPELFLKRLHIKMPYWTGYMKNLPGLYAFISKPERLISTSVTIAMVNKKSLYGKNSTLDYAYKNKELKSLINRIDKKNCISSLIGNLGYYMTENLIKGTLPWAHNRRYKPEHHLKTLLSYLGFYYYEKNGKVFSNFIGAHPASIGIRKNGTIEIIPRIHVSSYFINIDDITIQAVSINPIKATDEVVVFTPEYRFKNDTDFLYNLSEFAPKIPIDSSKKRINIFVANEGNGEMPEEKIIKVWKGEAPIPSFGAVISLTEDYYNKLFCNNDLLKSSINITPIADDFNFANYSRILGGFVPAVSDYVHLYDVQYVDELMSALDQYGNALSPLAQAGRETRNFDPYIREPAGLFVETADKIGWILFDGRHELTIGVSIADAVKILTKMEKDNILPGNIRNAFFIDGGSAMKAYISELEGWAVKGVDVRTAIQDEEEEQNQDLKYNVSLKLLNRVAAGARNGPGNDPNGLNLYSTLQLPL